MIKRFKGLLTLLIGISIYLFFNASVGVVEAAACNPGSFPKWSEEKQEFKCTTLNTGQSKDINQLSFEAEKIANGSDIGTSWSHKFARFMVILSVGLSYATQVFAALSIVYSAYLYSTSEGEIKKIVRAKQLILLAFGGMFIATMALIIIKMISGAL